MPTVTLNLPSIAPDDVWGAQNNDNFLAIKAVVDNIVSTGSALSNVPNIDATQRENHTGTQPASTISDFSAAAVTAIAAALQAGSGINITNANGIITIASTGPNGVLYAFFNGTNYPARATITSNTSQPVIWQGPDNNKVTIGTGYAIDGLDQFEGY